MNIILLLLNYVTCSNIELCHKCQKKFSGPFFEQYFWQVANAFNEWVFNKAMEQIRKLDAAAYHYLMDIPLQQWSRWKFDPSICSGDNTNNFTESFNATLGLDRVRPILGLLEGKYNGE